MDSFQSAVTLIHCALDRGGVTLDSSGEPLHVTDKRWIVAVRPALSVNVAPQVTSRENASLWLDVVEGTLAPDEGVGSWLDPDTRQITLDVVRFTRSKAEAVRLGRECGQKAIYHPATDTTVNLQRT